MAGAMAPEMTELERQLQLQYFFDQGFRRISCERCHSWFWTLDPQRKVCGDAPCVEYTFLGRPLTSKPVGLDQMREKFQSFFEARGHTRVPRYPVVARWREDIYLTIASIADFQPWVTSGQSKPPANPLVISQPCIRLNDLANVGKSGRHFTTFEMMAHHAFNRPNDEHYWADKTVEYCDGFLTKTLDIPREAITYKENPWAGGGNAGPALEVLAGGLEVATLVFMNLRQDPNGTVDVKGEKYSPMPMRIVDTGWGLERLTWATQGTPTAYDAVFPELIEFVRTHSDVGFDLDKERVRHIVSEHARLAGVMNLDASSNLHELRAGVAKRLAERKIKVDADELARIMTPIENAYALSDHAKCLAFMLGDGIVPSNAKAGYLARLIIRRSLRIMEALRFRQPLSELVSKEIDFLSPKFPELRRQHATVLEVLDLETGRYRETVEKGTRLIQRTFKKGQKIGNDQLVELYDTHGMQPQVVQQIAQPLQVQVDIPDAFDAMIAEKHNKAKAEEAVRRLPEVKAPRTRQLYYETPEAIEFDASVLWSDDEWVVLDQTLMYPEGGGQPNDAGLLAVGERAYKVRDVQLQDGLIYHRVDGRLKVGELVHGRLDVERRLGHMRHHTATHIINGAARAILGDHVWQTGAAKSMDSARIDLTHFQRITPEELRRIEALANEIVMQNVSLDRVWMERDEAEKKYGVRIYQGGVAPGGKIRIIRIGNHDVEACAGTHAPKTSDVGLIKIVRSERIQDGVERLEYSAGPHAIKFIQGQLDLLQRAADTLSVPAEKLPQTAQRFFDEWKQRGKTIESLQEEVSGLRFLDLLARAEKVDGVSVVVFQGRPEDLQPLATRVAAEENVVGILGGADEKSARILVVRGRTVSKVHAGEVVKAATALLGGSGGGKPESAQGGGPNTGQLQQAIDAAVDAVRKRLA